MNKVRFLATFLVLFAVFLILWSTLEGSRWYTRAVLACAGIVGPTLHGWVLEANAAGGPVWAHGNNQVRAAIQFDALAVGVVPVLALLAATPALSLRRRGTLMCIGAALCFLIDSLIVALFPLLVFYKNWFTDVLGTFLGLIAFVGAPVIIWGVLTFRQLQELLPPLRRRALATQTRP
ncbi:MAG TPA: hypothetical protein VMW56_12465 [Candidatus Margulisiibacteriota bacterium]|nr:hypothetical protein [Candidatus Margulisiibacteriota bacterium]